MLALLLLMSSLSRAGIGAAAVSCLFLCVGLRQYRLLIKGFALAIVLAVVAALFVPQPTDFGQIDASEPISTRFLYKGHPETGLFGSRESVWKQTWDVIKANPWFGSGFGTSFTQNDASRPGLSGYHIDSWIIREHGNSYLAIAEWVGLLGLVPFYVLAALAALNVRKVFVWMRQTGEAFSPAIPPAAIIVAGLVHAGFEDWMFAVGYYLSVFYWTMAFILVDLVPREGAAHSSDLTMFAEPQFQTVLPTAS
jgi:O-antigen ligase